MPGVASIVIQVDEKGAVQSFNNLNAASKQLDPGLQKVGQRGNVVFTDLENRSKKAAQAGQLLANITGVQLPRALEQVLAKTPGVQSALNAAFAASVVVTLGKEILNLVDSLTGYSEQLAKIQAQSTAIITSVQNANSDLLGPQTLKQLNEQIVNSQKRINEMNAQLGLTGDFYSDIVKRGLAKYSAAESNLLDQLDHELELQNRLREAAAKKTEEQRTTSVIQILEAENQKREAGLQGIKALEIAEKNRVKEMQESGKLLAEDPDVTGARVAALKAQYDAQIEQYR